MITVDDRYLRLSQCTILCAARAEHVFGAMRKTERGGLQFEGAKNGLMGDFAKRGNHLKFPQGQDRCGEKGAAIVNFGWCGLVLRRHTAHGIGDHARHEAQAVAARRLVSAGGEAIIDQSLVKKLAGEIASEGPAGAVCAAEAGRQANDEELGVARAERRNRRIVPLRLSVSQRITELYEARAKGAVRIRLRRGPVLREAGTCRRTFGDFYGRSSISAGSN